MCDQRVPAAADDDVAVTCEGIGFKVSWYILFLVFWGGFFCVGYVYFETRRDFDMKKKKRRRRRRRERKVGKREKGKKGEMERREGV